MIKILKHLEASMLLIVATVIVGNGLNLNSAEICLASSCCIAGQYAPELLKFLEKAFKGN